jgi:hypothetical protein
MDFAMAASQSGFNSCKLYLLKKTNIIRKMTKSMTVFIAFIFYHRAVVKQGDYMKHLLSYANTVQSPESQFKNSYQIRLRTSRNRLSPEDDFRQLVSSDDLFRFTMMTFRHHQITEDDFPGPS